jgi:O-antigen biosynthesis protein WbqP
VIRFFDLLISTALIVALSPLFLLTLLAVWITIGPPIFCQDRVGQHREIFRLYKFRTMPLQTPSLPTHQLTDIEISHLGRLLRRFKLDELPQLLNVLLGDMSLVGPRPCLPSQSDLISLRSERLLYERRPGITGLSQLSGIDMSTPKLLAKVDALMFREFSICVYFMYIIRTGIGQGRGDRLRMPPK